MATSKYKVRAGHTVTVGIEGDDGPQQKVYREGEQVELTKEQAEAMPHAIELDPKNSKTLAQRRREAEEELRKITEEEAKQNRKGRSKAAEKEREAALKTIQDRPDNAASGIPFFGRVPDTDIAALEARQEAVGQGLDASDFDENADPNTGKGFQREGAAFGAPAVAPPPSVPQQGLGDTSQSDSTKKSK